MQIQQEILPDSLSPFSFRVRTPAQFRTQAKTGLQAVEAPTKLGRVPVCTVEGPLRASKKLLCVN